jgi:hypothetical protein
MHRRFNQRLNVAAVSVKEQINSFECVFEEIIDADGPLSKMSGCKWWAVRDLNLRPPVCKTDALPLS